MVQPDMCQKGVRWGGGEYWMKESEKINQSSWTDNSMVRTRERGRWDLGGGGQTGEKWEHL